MRIIFFSGSVVFAEIAGVFKVVGISFQKPYILNFHRIFQEKLNVAFA